MISPNASTSLTESLSCISSGAWGVGVSGGADSVGLLRGLCEFRKDLSLHVVHLDHQMRGAQSTQDAVFVANLAKSLALPLTLARLSELPSDPRTSRNRSAQFRRARMKLFAEVQGKHELNGILLAHHADDQAETVLQRLLRGAGPAGISPMRAEKQIGSLCLLRPLLKIRGEHLRMYLRSIGQPWREDASNASDAYQRNRLRRILQNDAVLLERLLELGRAGQQLVDWTRSSAPVLPDSFACELLMNRPGPLAREAARQWLIARGSPPGELTRATLERLCTLALDRASPRAQVFPGNVRVRRQAGKIIVDNVSTI